VKVRRIHKPPGTVVLSGGITEREIEMLDIPTQIMDRDDLLFLAFRGSVAHGMYVPDSDPNSVDDVDLIGAYFGKVRDYLGFGKPKVKVEVYNGKWDTVMYEVKHFIHLLAKGNPNVLGTLWLNDEHYIYRSCSFNEILSKKQLFVSKQSYSSFSGYADSQRKRMTAIAGNGYLGAKRKALVEKHGYDTKNAAHCVRLLRMCIGFLKTGYMDVDRTHIDADELLDIKLGGKSLMIVGHIIDELLKEAKEAYESSTLPETPDMEAIEAMTVTMLREYLALEFDVADLDRYVKFPPISRCAVKGKVIREEDEG
jgi:predicted nucleotidyltransferase